MKKMMEKHRKFMKGDAGFSLVELIIVIAIMAALVAILAPQYLKYVERSRIAADQTVLNEIATAVKTTAADPDGNYSWGTSGDITVTFSGSAGGKLTLQPTTPAEFGKNLQAALGTDSITLTSSVGKTITEVTFTVDTYESTGTATYAVTAACEPNNANFAKIWSGTIG
jgi:type IV pilus assembly protein PilA